MRKKRPLRICILTSGFPRFKGDSSGTFLPFLARELIKTGLNVFVLAPHHQGSRRFEIMKGIKIYRFSYFFPFALQKLCYGSGIPTNIRHSLLARLQLPFFFLSQLFSLIWLIKKEKIDIVNSHWMVAQGLNGALARKILGIRHVNTIHSAGVFALKRFLFGRYIARFIVSNSDHTITVSSFIKSNLDELVGYDTEATICPMGIDTNTFVPKDRVKLKEKYNIKSKYILLFVGRLIEVKGIEYLIDALGIVSNKIPDLELLIAGTGNLERQLKEKVRKSNLSSYVSFLGAVKHEDLIDYYNICDLLVLPSIFDKYGHTETLGMVILEAMSCGKPVVASDIGGIPESVRNGYNGLLTIPKDPANIADKIVKAFTQFDLEEMGKRAHQTALNYAWEKISKKYEQVMKQVSVVNRRGKKDL